MLNFGAKNNNFDLSCYYKYVIFMEIYKHICNF